MVARQGLPRSVPVIPSRGSPGDHQTKELFSEFADNEHNLQGFRFNLIPEDFKVWICKKDNIGVKWLEN